MYDYSSILSLKGLLVVNHSDRPKWQFHLFIFPFLGSPKIEDIPQQHVINMFKAKNNFKHQPFGSQQDILILTFINLQNSLKEIVQKLDNLQCLAKSADFSLEVYLLFILLVDHLNLYKCNLLII